MTGGVIRTPTLRNVALTAPYMHDGSLATLASVIDYYAAGGVPHDGQDPLHRTVRVDAATSGRISSRSSNR